MTLTPTIRAGGAGRGDSATLRTRDQRKYLLTYLLTHSLTYLLTYLPTYLPSADPRPEEDGKPHPNLNPNSADPRPEEDGKPHPNLNPNSADPRPEEDGKPAAARAAGRPQSKSSQASSGQATEARGAAPAAALIA